MACPDQPDRQPVQRHRLALLAARVLVGEEKVLLVFGPPMKKEMMLHGSVILDEEEKMVLSSGASVATWCFWGLFSQLVRDGGIGT